MAPGQDNHSLSSVECPTALITVAFLENNPSSCNDIIFINFHVFVFDNLKFVVFVFGHWEINEFAFVFVTKWIWPHPWPRQHQTSTAYLTVSRNQYCRTQATLLQPDSLHAHTMAAYLLAISQTQPAWLVHRLLSVLSAHKQHTIKPHSFHWLQWGQVVSLKSAINHH